MSNTAMIDQFGAAAVKATAIRVRLEAELKAAIEWEKTILRELDGALKEHEQATTKSN